MTDTGDHPNVETHEESFDWTVSIPTAPRNDAILRVKSFSIRAVGDTDVICFVACCSLARTASTVSQQAQLFVFELSNLSGAEPGAEADPSLECTFSYSVGTPGRLWFEQETSFPLTTKHVIGRGDHSEESDTIEVNLNIRLIRNSRWPDKTISAPMSVESFGTAWLNESELSDVVVTCGGKSFDCHKVILAGRSPVFRWMLTGPFKEARENKVEIVGFEPEVAELLIKFIYTDDVQEESISWELFEAAKMYDLVRLQELCLKCLRKNISVQNCCRMLEAAMVHDLDDYFVLAMDFFKKNKEEVSNSEGWKEQVLTNNALLGKIILYQM